MYQEILFEETVTILQVEFNDESMRKKKEEVEDVIVEMLKLNLPKR